MNLQEILNDQFLNKRVLVRVLERDKFGKNIPDSFVWIGGICTFIGSNRLLKIDLQINLENHPVWIKHISDIKISENQNDKRKFTTEKIERDKDKT